MGRDIHIINLLPRRTNVSDITTALPRGMTHPADQPCPFARDGFPISSMDICCSLRGDMLAFDLEGMGETDLYEDVLRDLGVEEALQLATSLRQCAGRLGKQEMQHAEWAPFAEQQVLAATGGKPDPLLRCMFEGTVVTLRRSADWYEKVARLGFGVERGR